MNLRTLLATITCILLATTSLVAQDRLDAYAKFRGTIAIFSDMETTNANRDGWGFDETTGFGYEIGTVIELKRGLRVELGFLGLPGVHFDGAQIENGASTEAQGSDADLYLDAYAFMTDLHWEFTHLFMPESAFQASVGLGLGLSYISVDKMEHGSGSFLQTIDGESGWNPAYRLSLGAKYRVSEEIVLTCSYSYMYLGEAELGNNWTESNGLSGTNFQRNVDLDLEAQILQIGLYMVF